MTRQLEALLTQADEVQLRRLSTEQLSLLIDLSEQLGLHLDHPEVIALARRVSGEV